MKKGFTLVEIILSIALIVVVGVSSTVGVIVVRNNNIKKLDAMSEEIYTAVHLLIETDEETKSQLYESKNGVIIPLSKLESEGLVDFEGINIEDEYVLTMLGNNLESEACSGSLYDIGTWTKSSDDIIYICGDASKSGNIKDTLIENSNTYVAKGADPNNWVVFPVISDETQITYFPNNSEKDLWRILWIDENDNIKLVYNDAIASDFTSLFNDFDGTTEKLYEYITNYNYIKTSKFFHTYQYKHYGVHGTQVSFDYYGIALDLNEAILQNLGSITYNEFYSTITPSTIETWLPKNIVIGTLETGNVKMLVSIDDDYSYTFPNSSTSSIVLLPTITLKSEVQLEKNTDCPANSIQGSKDCPYKLSCLEY